MLYEIILANDNYTTATNNYFISKRTIIHDNNYTIQNNNPHILTDRIK